MGPLSASRAVGAVISARVFLVVIVISLESRLAPIVFLGIVRNLAVLPFIVTPMKYIAGPTAKYSAVRFNSWISAAVPTVAPSVVSEDLASRVPAADQRPATTLLV